MQDSNETLKIIDQEIEVVTVESIPLGVKKSAAEEFSKLLGEANLSIAGPIYFNLHRCLWTGYRYVVTIKTVDGMMHQLAFSYDDY